jgi:hypothetical protein
MGFGDIIRKNLPIADRLTGGTGGVQDDIVVYPWIGNTLEGGPDYGDPVTMGAIVYEREYQRRMPTGEEVTQRAELTIPRPIAANGAADRREPLDPRDKIVLPSGYTGPILHVDGLTDPTTHAPFMFVVILG